MNLLRTLGTWGLVLFDLSPLDPLTNLRLWTEGHGLEPTTLPDIPILSLCDSKKFKNQKKKKKGTFLPLASVVMSVEEKHVLLFCFVLCCLLKVNIKGFNFGRYRDIQ